MIAPVEKSFNENIRTCCIHAFLFCFGLKADRYRILDIIIAVIFPRGQGHQNLRPRNARSISKSFLNGIIGTYHIISPIT